MATKLFDECKKENGSVTVDGVEIALYDQAYLSGDCYQAIGITREQAAVDDFDPMFDSHHTLYWETLNDNEDESERCDWDNPVSVDLV